MKWHYPYHWGDTRKDIGCPALVNINKKMEESNRKINRDVPEELSNKSEMSRVMVEINSIRQMIKSTTLNDTFVPNKNLHLKKWAEDLDTKEAFTSNIEASVVNDIMLLQTRKMIVTCKWYTCLFSLPLHFYDEKSKCYIMASKCNILLGKQR